MNAEAKQSHRVRNLSILAVVIVSAFVLLFRPQHLYFRPLNPEEVLQLLGPIILLALFIERALEVMVTALREEKKTQKKIVLREAEAVAAPEDKIKLKSDIEAYRAQTQRRAGAAAIGLGILISMAGVRLIESVLGQDFIPDLPSGQRQLFIILDTLVTGAILGGGAAGIHEIAALFSDYLGKARAKTQEA